MRVKGSRKKSLHSGASGGRADARPPPRPGGLRCPLLASGLAGSSKMQTLFIDRPLMEITEVKEIERQKRKGRTLVRPFLFAQQASVSC
jgi:hypothetical protein